jgi:hypothetical protein
MPAAISASQHGPVRPWWAQGSSVTQAVAPRTLLPLPRSITQRHHLGMRAASLLGKAFTQHLPIGRGDDAAYTRVGVGKKKRLGG